MCASRKILKTINQLRKQDSKQIVSHHIENCDLNNPEVFKNKRKRRKSSYKNTKSKQHLGFITASVSSLSSFF